MYSEYNLIESKDKFLKKYLLFLINYLSKELIADNKFIWGKKKE